MVFVLAEKSRARGHVESDSIKSLGGVMKIFCLVNAVRAERGESLR